MKKKLFQAVNNISTLCKKHIFIWQSRKIAAANITSYLS